MVVLDNQGWLDATVWADLLTSVASCREVAGTVLDGMCRDVNRALAEGCPIFSRGNWMRTSKDRVQVESIGEQVAISGGGWSPGNWLHGVAAVPAARIGEVISAAKEIAAAEDRIRAAVEQGAIAARGPAAALVAKSTVRQRKVMHYGSAQAPPLATDAH